MATVIGLTWHYRQPSDLDAAMHQAIVSGAISLWLTKSGYYHNAITAHRGKPRKRHKPYEPKRDPTISGNCQWLHHPRCHVLTCECPCHENGDDAPRTYRQRDDNWRPYMGPKTVDEYRAYYRELRRKQREGKAHPCPTCGKGRVIRTDAKCKQCAARAREERISKEGKPNNRGKAFLRKCSHLNKN